MLCTKLHQGRPICVSTLTNQPADGTLCGSNKVRTSCIDLRPPLSFDSVVSARHMYADELPVRNALDSRRLESMDTVEFVFTHMWTGCGISTPIMHSSQVSVSNGTVPNLHRLSRELDRRLAVNNALAYESGIVHAPLP